MIMSNVGSDIYCAPEVADNCYNLKADIWSFGVIYYEMLTGSLPTKAEIYIDRKIKDFPIKEIQPS